MIQNTHITNTWTCIQITLLTERIPVRSQKMKVKNNHLGDPVMEDTQTRQGKEWAITQEKYLTKAREEWRKLSLK